MAGGGAFNPVKIGADETEIIRTRESLRLRSIGWALLLWWAVALVVIGLCISLEKANLRVVALNLVGGLLIILAVAGGLAFWYVYIVWSRGAYTLSSQMICRAGDVGDELPIFGRRDGQSGAIGIECADVVKATPQDVPWLSALFGVGHVRITTRKQAGAFVLRFMKHHEALAREINGYSATSEEGAEKKPSPRTLHRAGIWLGFWVAMIVTVYWACVAAWIGLTLVGAYGTDVVFLGVFIGALVWAVLLLPRTIITFLDWWFCVYVVTNRRVVARKGVLKVTERVLSLDDIVSASVTKFGLFRYLGMGNVQVNTAGLTGTVTMARVSDADYIRQQVLAIQAQIQRSRQQLELSEIRRRLTKTLHMH